MSEIGSIGIASSIAGENVMRSRLFSSGELTRATVTTATIQQIDYTQELEMQCDRTAKLNRLIKRNGRHFNTSGA